MTFSTYLEFLNIVFTVLTFSIIGNNGDVEEGVILKVLKQLSISKEDWLFGIVGSGIVLAIIQLFLLIS